jgi:hypothetical protein
MKQEKNKYLFNAAVFLLAAIISIIRLEQVEIIISFLFSGIFIVLGLLQEKAGRKILSERFDLKING